MRKSGVTGIFELGGIEWPVLVALFVAWIANFVCLSKGIKSIGKVSVSVLCCSLYLPRFCVPTIFRQQTTT